MANKIKYGICNVYFSTCSIGTNGSATYTTPVALPGAVNLSLEPQGDNVDFYADNITYWVGNGNNGYSGTLELARIPESFKLNVLNMAKDANQVLYEDMDAPIAHFALTFQFEGDEKATRHIMYNCTAQRASEAGQTKGESIEPQTETINISAKSVYVSSLDKNVVKAECEYGNSKYSTWNTTIYQPGLTT